MFIKFHCKRVNFYIILLTIINVGNLCYSVNSKLLSFMLGNYICKKDTVCNLL
jgi:hypothetical protein